MSTTSQATHHHFARSRQNKAALQLAPARQRRLHLCLAWGLGSRLLILLLLLPGTIEAKGLAQDVLPEPVHLTVTSAESADLLVDLSTPMTHAFSPTAKWTGYLEFLGKPGTARSLGQPDLFLPVLQDANDMTFLNIRGQLQFDHTDNNETNIGLGHRHMFQEWILGGYGYYDRRNTQFGSHVNQFTGGLEAMSVDWGFRVNGYLPENQTTTFTGDAEVSVLRPGDEIKVQIDGVVQEKALPGVDGEVGYLLPIPWKAYTAVFDETRVYAGGYHFIGEDQFESVTGPRGRVEWRAYDLPVLGPGSRLMMGVEAQWDEPRGSQAFGLFSLRIPFDVFSDKSKRKALTGLDRRMLQPVIRDVDVVTGEFDVPTETLPALNQAGHAYTHVVEVEAADEAAVQAAIDANTVGTPLIIPKNNGGMISLADSLTLNTNQTLGGAGGQGGLRVNYQSAWLGGGSVGYDPGGAATGFLARAAVDGGFSDNLLIDMALDSEVNGLTLDANQISANGLLIDTTGGDAAGTRWVANSTITNTPDPGAGLGDVLRAEGSGAVFRIDNSRFTGSTGAGGDSGVKALGDGATIYIRNSYVGNNGGYGVRADSGGTIIADHMHIENNGLNSPGTSSGAGVAAFGAGSTVEITDSTVRNNVDGLEAGSGATLVAERMEVTKNRDQGVEVFSTATMTISDSRIFDNDGGGAETFLGTLTILRSEIYDNRDDGDGAVTNFGGTLTIEDTQIRDNDGIGVHAESLGSFSDPQATTTLRNVTITGNTGAAVTSKGDSIVTITDSTIGGSLDLVCDDDDSGLPADPRYDLFGTIIVNGMTVPGSGVSPCP